MCGFVLFDHTLKLKRVFVFNFPLELFTFVDFQCIIHDNRQLKQEKKHLVGTLSRPHLVDHT